MRLKKMVEKIDLPKKKFPSKERIQLNVAYVLIIVCAITVFFWIQKDDLIIAPTNTTEFKEYKQPAMCSEKCLKNPVNISEQLLMYFTENRMNPFYEPYINDIGCYDYDLIEHKECCVMYTMRK